MAKVLQLQGKEEVSLQDLKAMVSGVIECLVSCVANVEMHQRAKLSTSLEFMMDVDAFVDKLSLNAEDTGGIITLVQQVKATDK